jgi:4'-phosphopantetheinyl transferase EntD
VIEELVPPAVAVAESFGDIPGARLFPEEEAVVARSVDKRRREFTTARACARTALDRLGLPAAAIGRGERGAPCWPPGVVGSITHCDGYRAAALARGDDVVTIGVDAEPNEPIPPEVLELVADDAERAWVTELRAAAPQVSWDRLLFCAKEAVYKAWFPLTWRWLDFSEASVTVDATAGTFAARLLVSATRPDGQPLTGFTGRWLARDGLVLTAIVLPGDGSAGDAG